LNEPADIGFVRGEAAGELDAGLEESMVQGAGLGNEGDARTPSLAPTITRHAHDEAHGVLTMLAEAVPECQRACRALGAGDELKTSTAISI
jgi:hypothetical protein